MKLNALDGNILGDFFEELTAPGRKQTPPVFLVTGGQQGEANVPRYLRPQPVETHGYFQDVPPR